MWEDLYTSVVLYNYNSQIKLDISTCDRNVSFLYLENTPDSSALFLLQYSRCGIDKPNKLEN